MNAASDGDSKSFVCYFCRDVTRLKAIHAAVRIANRKRSYTYLSTLVCCHRTSEALSISQKFKKYISPTLQALHLFLQLLKLAYIVHIQGNLWASAGNLALSLVVREDAIDV